MSRVVFNENSIWLNRQCCLGWILFISSFPFIYILKLISDSFLNSQASIISHVQLSNIFLYQTSLKSFLRNTLKLKSSKLNLLFKNFDVISRPPLILLQTLSVKRKINFSWNKNLSSLNNLGASGAVLVLVENQFVKVETQSEIFRLFTFSPLTFFLSSKTLPFTKRKLFFVLSCYGTWSNFDWYTMFFWLLACSSSFLLKPNAVIRQK